MTGTARDEFLRRYATSPIHVPRLERLLAVYGDDAVGDSFCSRFIEWDRACPDAEAARIVSEILSTGDQVGGIRRISDDAVKGAIRWMSGVTALPVGERARVLREGLSAASEPARAEFVGFLSRADAMEASQFSDEAQAAARRLAG
jgi:hypothetical protein